MVTSKTRRENAESGFMASAALTKNMQRVLVDLIELSSQSKQAHWGVVGRNFRDLHLQLDEIIATARAASDTVAERLRALHAVPDGRSTPTDTSETVDLITARLEAAVATMRDVHDQVDEEDPTTADILHAIIASLEQYAWMVSAENRTPAKR